MFKKFILLSLVFVLAACSAPVSQKTEESLTVEEAVAQLLAATEMVEESAAESETTQAETISTSLTYPLVETGQGFCYDNDGAKIDCPAEGEALYGQDAQFTGNPFSYTDNGDGTVTDNVTGLIWQQTPDSGNYSWNEAQAYCESLELGGIDDWRMPSLKELFSISNFSAGWPYLDMTYFDLTTNESISKDEQYWSDNYYVGKTSEGQYDAAFGVNHATGHIKAYPALVTGPMGKRVRCVSGDTYGINEFMDNGDGTITDQATGLMWSQTDSDEGMDWESALAYAQTQNDANYFGYSDWRLPNVKELQSIVDYNYAPDAQDAAYDGPALDPKFSVSGITNEAGLADYPYYWTSTSSGSNPVEISTMPGMLLAVARWTVKAMTLTAQVRYALIPRLRAARLVKVENVTTTTCVWCAVEMSPKPLMEIPMPMMSDQSLNSLITVRVPRMVRTISRALHKVLREADSQRLTQRPQQQHWV